MRLVAISADDHDDARRFAKQGRIGFPLLRDADLRVADAYGVAMKDEEVAIPSTFIIDASGRIHWKHVGETQLDRADFEQVLAILDELLAE